MNINFNLKGRSLMNEIDTEIKVLPEATKELRVVIYARVASAQQLDSEV